MKNKPLLLAVSGVKNSGKTTLIEAILPLLAQKGIKTAVIKHDGHSYTPDVPGTDSFRFFAAGALGTAIFDGEKFTVTKKAAATEAQLAAQFPEADIVLLEGFKDSPYPKLELVRSGNSDSPVCAGDSCLAYVSDLPLATAKPVFGQSDYESVAEFICSYIKENSDA